MCVYIYICPCACTHVSLHMYLCICVQTCIQMCICVYLTSMYVCVHTQAHVCVCFEKAHIYRDIWAALVSYSLIMFKSRGIEKIGFGAVLWNCHTAPREIPMTPSISSTVSVSVMLNLPHMDFLDII